MTAAVAVGSVIVRTFVTELNEAVKKGITMPLLLRVTVGFPHTVTDGPV